MTGPRGDETLRALARNAALRTAAQTIVVTVLFAVVAGARQVLGVDGPINWRQVALVAGQGGVMAVIAAVVRFTQTGRLEPVPLRWDAWIRSARTLAAGLVVVGLLAVGQVVTSLGGEPFDTGRVLRAVAVAAAMAVTAYLHRWALDPTAIPSAAPPASVEEV